MKSLETEYRDAISLELPDLWSRIEAGVDEYEAKKKNEKITYINTEEEKETDEDTVIKKINRKKTIAAISRYAAAAACLILAVGAFKVMGGSRKSESATAMSDAASTYNAAESAACDEAAAEASYEKADEPDMAFDSEESASFDAAPAAVAQAEESENAENYKDTLSADNDSRQYAKAGDSVRVEDQMILALSEAFECEASEATKIAFQLTVVGIKSPAGFEAVELDEDLTNNIELKNAQNVLIYGFTDEATSDKYLMYIDKAQDGTLKLLSVIRNDDTKEVIYEENKAD